MLKSLNLGYDALEDRLVLRVRTDESPDDQVLHLTRRVCAQWRVDLERLVDQSAQVPEHLPAATRAAVASAHHQAVAAQAPIRGEPPPPPPRGPVHLVTGIRCGHNRSNQHWVVQFTAANGGQLNLQLSQQTLHGLVNLLRQQVAKAGWGLPAQASDQAPSTAGLGNALH